MILHTKIEKETTKINMSFHKKTRCRKSPESWTGSRHDGPGLRKDCHSGCCTGGCKDCHMGCAAGSST